MANYANNLRGLKFRRLHGNSRGPRNWLGHEMFEVLGDSELPGDILRVWIKAWSEGEGRRVDLLEIQVTEFQELLDMYTLADNMTHGVK